MSEAAYGGRAEPYQFFLLTIFPSVRGSAGAFHIAGQEYLIDFSW